MNTAKEGHMNTGAAYPDEILVVDDTSGSLKLLEEILTAAGYRVRLSSDGELALRSVRIQPPALVLLDIRMPGMDGYEVCRRLKEDDNTRSIPVIFLSILEDDGEKVKAFEAGGVDYINKPFRPAEVLARVKTHLALRHAQMDLESRNAELEKARETLEERVRERSAELEQSNRKLREQIEVHLQTLEALREREESIVRLVENAPVAKVISSGSDEKVVLVNKKFTELFGYTSEDLPDVAHWWPLACPEENYRESISSQWGERVGKAIRERGEIEPMEAAVTCKDGSRRYIEYRFSSIGKQHIVTFVDLTERKTAEEKLKALNEELDRRVRERTKDLERRNFELVQMNKAFVGRELRMVELKGRISELEGHLDIH